MENETDPEKTALPGQIYTVEDLLRRMIVYSDNNSKQLLLTYINSLKPGEDLVAKTFEQLGLVPKEEVQDYVITVKGYASIFRQLYNSSYLNSAMSEYALNLLSKVEFKDGLTPGIPSDITVAHKFGVRDREGGEKQLHDCGIVYMPQLPYLLCIMTRSQNLDEDAHAIQEVSRQIYQEVEERTHDTIDRNVP